MTARQLVLPAYRGRAPGNNWVRTVLRTPSAATTRPASPVCSPVLVRQVAAAGSPPGAPGWTAVTSAPVTSSAPASSAACRSVACSRWR